MHHVDFGSSVSGCERAPFVVPASGGKWKDRLKAIVRLRAHEQIAGRFGRAAATAARRQAASTYKQYVCFAVLRNLVLAAPKSAIYSFASPYLFGLAFPTSSSLLCHSSRNRRYWIPPAGAPRSLAASKIGSSVSRCEWQFVGVPASAGKRKPPKGGTPTMAACT